jgi:hypothetical protein
MNLSKTIISEHFNKLNNFKNELNNQVYLSKDDVEQLLCQAFEGYSDKPTDHKLISLNLTNKQWNILLFHLSIPAQTAQPLSAFGLVISVVFFAIINSFFIFFP